MLMFDKTKTTVNLKQERTCGSQYHAIVIGGGIAGLLAARVLTDYFDQVTIIERDRFPKKPQPRQGVPQSYHPHVLLLQGQLILERLFPKLKDELLCNGAQCVNWTMDFRWLLMGNWTPRFPSEMVSLACTRNLLEAVIRQRLVNDTRVKLLEANQVTGLLTNTDNTAVVGVRLQDSNGKEAEIPAQLVVDASGRNSKAPKWLQSLGYEMPQETTVKSFLGYATRWYQTLGKSPVDYKMLYLMPKAPDHPRGGVIHQVEDGLWLVNLIGVGRDYPPLDEAGFLNFALSMCIPELYEAIKEAQPISPVYGYQRTENRWRHYEQLSRLPENFVMLGDAVCAFNPVYGQGITVAALGALTLDRCLKRQKPSCSDRVLTGFAQRFQKQLAKVNVVPWLMATGDDFRWPTTEGGQPNFRIRLQHWYLNQVMLAASESTEVYKVLLEVIHLLKPPTVLFQFKVLIHILKPTFCRLKQRSRYFFERLKSLGSRKF